MVTCIAFSIAKPFRKQIWTNYPYLFSILAILAVDTLLVFLPYDSWLSMLFNILPFAKDGQTYYSYKAWIGLGILLNSIVTYAAETVIILTLTRKADKMGKLKKQAEYDAKMDREELALRERGVPVVAAPANKAKSKNKTLEILASNNYGVLR